MRTYVAVDGGMSDNPRPGPLRLGLRGVPPACDDAPRRRRAARVVGKHCESGDVLVDDARLPSDVHVGDVLCTPVTGAYGYSMASTYNRVGRPAVALRPRRAARASVLRRETAAGPRVARVHVTDGSATPSASRSSAAAPSAPRSPARSPTRPTAAGARRRRRRAARARRRRRSARGVATGRRRPRARHDGRRWALSHGAGPTSSSSSSAGRASVATLLRQAIDGGRVGRDGQQGAARHPAPRRSPSAPRRGDVDLLYEAAVAGAIPIVRVLRTSLAGQRLDRVLGIVNGTTNYLLTTMTREGREPPGRARRGDRTAASPSATRRRTSRATTPPRRPRSSRPWPSAPRSPTPTCRARGSPRSRSRTSRRRRGWATSCASSRSPSGSATTPSPSACTRRWCRRRTRSPRSTARRTRSSSRATRSGR